MKGDWARQLEDDLKWREDELAALRIEYTRVRGEPARAGLLRALWVMLYAHYQGFCCFAWDLHLNAVNQAGLRREEVSDSIAKLSLDEDFRRLRRGASNDKLWLFYREFPGLMLAPVRITASLDESNLSPRALRHACERIGLHLSTVDGNEPLLWKLVRDRHEIAHGKQLPVSSMDEYLRHERCAWHTMIDLAVTVLEAVEDEHFRHPVPSGQA